MNRERLRTRLEARLNIPVRLEDRDPTTGTVDPDTAELIPTDPDVKWRGLVMIRSSLTARTYDAAGIVGSDRAVTIRFPVGVAPKVGQWIVVENEFGGVVADEDQVGDCYLVEGLDPSSTRISNQVQASRWDH